MSLPYVNYGGREHGIGRTEEAGGAAGGVSGEEADSRYPNLITVEAMHEASRLTWMAKRYYGAKIYWPYLYDANRDVIKNANSIEVGTPIRVPKLTKLQLDTTNAETMATLERLQKEALGSGE